MIPGSSNPLLAFMSAGASQYQISRSLRFNAGDLASLSRTIASAGDRKTWTWSGWIKRSGLGALNIVFSSGVDASNNFRFGFDASDKLFVSNEAAGVTTSLRTTTAAYRDTAAWAHVVLAIDTTQATASNRVKLYVNGAEVTAFSTSADPTQNADLNCNAAGTFYIGRNFSSNLLNAYLADIHFISGSALTPTSFGETDATTGEWIPKAFSGSYGTNGHRLTFSDNSAATATALGADSSGNGNNFTPANFSVSADVNNDSLVDSPTSYGTDTGAGGEVRGNYCTLNPISLTTDIIPTNGNIEHTSTTTNATAIGTIGVSTGYWYWEVVTNAFGGSQIAAGVYTEFGNFAATLPTSNVVYGIRLNAVSGSLDYTDNGTTWTSIATGLTSTSYFPYFRNLTTTAKTSSINFGQRPFTYTAPSGYKALCDTNLPAPTIVKPSAAMDAVLYTGTGSALTPTSSLGFSPDLVWIKGRSGVTDNTVYDSVRGAQVRLETNNNDIEVTTDGGLTAFNSNGFTLGTLAQVNTNTAIYAAWCWDESVSAGFDIVSYSGTGANTTVSHSLNVTPSLVIVKRRTVSTGNWIAWHSGIGGTSYIVLNTASTTQLDATVFTSTPSSTVLNIGTNSAVNASGGSYIAYCWAPVSGYSAFGTYTGNANANGPFIYTGFRPRWIMIKARSAAGTNWVIFDTARLGYNVDNNPLFPNLTSAEGVTDLIDITSSGFKIRSADADVNSTIVTHLYAAFAEFPFQYARAR